MTHLLTYETCVMSKGFCNRFNRVFRWLNSQRWNKMIVQEHAADDSNFTLTVKKFTEEHWEFDVSAKIIKLFNIKFILISL